MRRSRRLLLGLALPAVVLVAGCQAAAAPPGGLTPPEGAVHLVADKLVFEPTSLEVPAGESFVLFFENREAPPHNVHVRDESGATVMQGDVFSGSSARSHQMPALEEGRYPFLCDVHPDMIGELVAVAGQ